MTIPDFHTTGVENHLNKFSDKIRTEMALCGFNEVLTLTLTSIEENSLINNSMNGEAVKLGNFKSKDCEIVRTSLLPGMIKAIANNLQEKLPIKIFEVSDIVKLDDSVIGASNKRYFSGIIAANTSLLEDLQGTLTMVMKKAGIELTYLISDKPHFISNQSADIYIGKVLIGSIGVFNSNIVNNHFNIQYPLVGFEINLETVYDIFSN
ncbi:SYFB [Hepatospora eriocheir]|uniref:SYFB n=1 Tax=Hepatospora eriocheir TaxID=1081669 RepID=A0A1X0Q630_9MICR|nr:SYFB [Hepatospora eriocheir]